MNKRSALDSVFSRRVKEFVLAGFKRPVRQRKPRGSGSPLWVRLNGLGSELWLDSGDIDSLSRVWMANFSAVTTNNTLLNREVQKGTYDAFIASASELLDEWPELDEKTRRLELAFMLNAKHALKLVETFDAHVSVEEHTDLAADVDAAVYYGQRLYAICPERFYIKVPFCPAGLLAARRLGMAGVPVNVTLGFSARQAHVATRLARPRFVNVFLGRLGSFTLENAFGSGDYVGERATLAAQAVVRRLREEDGVDTRLIAASFRTAAQVRNLAGVDVLTIPPDVAESFQRQDLRAQDVFNRTAEPYEPVIEGNLEKTGFDTLWEVDERVEQCVDRLLQEDLNTMPAAALIRFFNRNGCGDVLVDWSAEQREQIREDGKIPRFDRWRDDLETRRIGLDSLMNAAGLAVFGADQEAMDRRIESVLPASAHA